MWGTPELLKGFFPGDDAQEADVFMLVSLNSNPNVTTDLLWNNQGTTGPITPTNFVEKVQQVSFVNRSAAGGTFTIYALNTVAATSSFTPVAEYYVAATAAFLLTGETIRVNAPPNCKLQFICTTTGDVVATARYIKGAGQ